MQFWSRGTVTFGFPHLESRVSILLLFLINTYVARECFQLIAISMQKIFHLMSSFHQIQADLFPLFVRLLS